MTVDLAAPEWLWLLAGLLPLAVLLLPGRLSGLVMADASRNGSAGWAWRGLELLPLVLRGLALASIAVALAQPQAVRVYEEPRVEGVGIALALDLSTSMWAEDMGARSSRLEVAKNTALNFIDRRDDDMGLVTVAGEA